MYSVVVDVDKYREFVPWCIRSDIMKPVQPNMFKAHMAIGFQLLKEQYTAVVTHSKPGLVKVCFVKFYFIYYDIFFLMFQSVCMDGVLFNHLITEWKFLPGIEKQPRSCVLDFYVSFFFRFEQFHVIQY